MTTVGIDLGGTAVVAQRGWPDGRWESNPLLGRHPTATSVLGYAAVCEGALVYLDRLLPRRWAFVLHAVVTSAEIVQQYRNTRCDLGHCEVSQ
jgi:hypothetical protein